MTERGLANGQRDGDHDLFFSELHAHRGLLISLAHRVLGDAPAAEDACQKTLLAAWTNRNELRDPSRLKAWMATTVVNECLAQLRRRRTEQRAMQQLASLAPAESSPIDLPVSMQREALLSALAVLDEAQRTVLTLRFIDGRSGKETAQILALSEGQVSKTLHHALERMRELMKEWQA